MFDIIAALTPAQRTRPSNTALFTTYHAYAERYFAASPIVQGCLQALSFLCPGRRRPYACLRPIVARRCGSKMRRSAQIYVQRANMLIRFIISAAVLPRQRAQRRSYDAR